MPPLEEMESALEQIRKDSLERSSGRRRPEFFGEILEILRSPLFRQSPGYEQRLESRYRQIIGMLIHEVSPPTAETLDAVLARLEKVIGRAPERVLIVHGADEARDAMADTPSQAEDLQAPIDLRANLPSRYPRTKAQRDLIEALRPPAERTRPFNRRDRTDG